MSKLGRLLGMIPLDDGLLRMVQYGSAVATGACAITAVLWAGDPAMPSPLFPVALGVANGSLAYLCRAYRTLADARLALHCFTQMELWLRDQGIARPVVPTPPAVVMAARSILWDKFGCAMKGDPYSPEKLPGAKVGREV